MNWDMNGLRTALDELVGFLPRLVAGLVILVLGYILARALRRLTIVLLRRVGFDRLVSRTGLTTPAAEPEIASRWAGTAVFIMVMLVTSMQVARSWNMSFVALGFARLIAYAPHLLAAAVIFGVALIVGNWVRDRLLRGATVNAAPTGSSIDTQLRLMPSVVRGIILGVGVFMALRELQIAPEIVNVAFTLMLGAIAVATALAFGLGGRDVAGRVAETWYERRGGPVGRGGRVPVGGGGGPIPPVASHSASSGTMTYQRRR